MYDKTDPYISISREMSVHVETMKLALLLLVMSVCLIDFVSARGVAMVGKAGNREARIKTCFKKHLCKVVIRSVDKNCFRI